MTVNSGGSVDVSEKGESLELNQNTNIFIVFGFITTIVALAFASVLMDMQNQLTQKDEEIETLQNQIMGLENDLGTVKKGAWNIV